jgi:hypothetical protein
VVVVGFSNFAARNSKQPSAHNKVKIHNQVLFSPSLHSYNPHFHHSLNRRQIDTAAMATIDPNEVLFDVDDAVPSAVNTSVDVDTSFASVEMNGPSAPPPMGAPPPATEEEGGTLVITVSCFWMRCCFFGCLVIRMKDCGGLGYNNVECIRPANQHVNLA